MNFRETYSPSKYYLNNDEIKLYEYYKEKKLNRKIILFYHIIFIVQLIMALFYYIFCV
jgi:hypothetical protein